MGAGKERAPGGRAVPVLLGARAAQPAVAVGAQDVRRPLLLALGTVLQAQRSAVTLDPPPGWPRGGAGRLEGCSLEGSQFWRAAWEGRMVACEAKHPL